MVIFRMGLSGDGRWLPVTWSHPGGWVEALYPILTAPLLQYSSGAIRALLLPTDGCAPVVAQLKTRILEVDG